MSNYLMLLKMCQRSLKPRSSPFTPRTILVSTLELICSPIDSIDYLPAVFRAERNKERRVKLNNPRSIPRDVLYPFLTYFTPSRLNNFIGNKCRRVINIFIGNIVARSPLCLCYCINLPCERIFNVLRFLRTALRRWGGCLSNVFLFRSLWWFLFGFTNVMYYNIAQEL